MGRICSAFGSEFGWCLGWHLGGDLVGVVAFWVVGGYLVVVRIKIWLDRPWVGGWLASNIACLSWILGCGLLVGMGLWVMALVASDWLWVASKCV